MKPKPDYCQRFAMIIRVGGALFLTMRSLPSSAQKPAPEDPEIRIGRDAAADNDKQIKLLTEPTMVGRVERIGQEIAAIANTTEIPALWGSSHVKKFVYSFKVVDDKDVNAYSLPGGFIYVNKGLLDYVRSDDELAGILAHEVAHAAHHHMMKLIKEQNKLQPLSILSLIALLAGGSNPQNNTAGLSLAAQLFITAKLNGMGIEAEKDADQAGIRYLSKTKYNPVGLLTFMERMAKDDRSRPRIELGIYQTHPASPERVESAVQLLMKLNVAIRRRDVDPQMRAAVVTLKQGAANISEVRMYKFVLAKLTDVEGSTSVQRADQVAKRLNDWLDDGVQAYEIRTLGESGRVIMRGRTLVEFAAADASVVGVTVGQLAQDCIKGLQSVLWQEQFDRLAPKEEFRPGGG